MINFLVFALLHFGVCLLFFWMVQRPMFYVYNRTIHVGVVRAADRKSIYAHGLKTDLIAASYLTALPLVVAGLYAAFPTQGLWYVLWAVHVLLSFVTALIVVADTALYRFWQFKIDASVFTYLRSLKGTFASVSMWFVVLALLVVCQVGAVLLVGFGLVDWNYRHVPSAIDVGWLYRGGIFLVFLLIGLGLFILIRGTGIRPYNPSIAYYSKNPFFNHCALNPLYSLAYSFSVKNKFATQFHAFDTAYCAKKFEPLFPTTGVPQVRLLNTARPNILLIVWESLSARYVASLGGVPGVMPCLTRLSDEGVLFTHCDAGSFRTDRGLVCLLSGYLGQPTTSVINYTRKLPHLPAFPRVLKAAGYATTAVHGGDLSIMHKADYYLASGHDRLVSQRDFPSSAPTGKWGVHDGYLFSWLYDDIQAKAAQGIRWYTTFQTLSSHEPFDVPYDGLKEDRIANAYAYVDDAFGRFVEQLKNTPAWENLLIICTADHGANFGEPLSRSAYPHIPLLLLGGAVRQPMRIDTLMSQTDLAATLLGQMDLPHNDFLFSRDVTADTYTYPFSFHTYNNGFLFRDRTGYTHYDNVSGQALEGGDARREELGKMILQTLYEDLDKR